MNSAIETVERLLLQLAPLQVRARAMFGEYALYCDDKLCVLICDDRYFLKRSTASQDWEGKLKSGEPYPGAKPCLIIDDALLRDRTKLRQLLQATADALPLPKPRRTQQLQVKKAKK